MAYQLHVNTRMSQIRLVKSYFERRSNNYILTYIDEHKDRAATTTHDQSLYSQT